jgi:hypothetical protein
LIIILEFLNDPAPNETGRSSQYDCLFHYPKCIKLSA